MPFNPSDFDPRSVDAEAQLLDIDRADCEESLYVFLKHAWRFIDPAPWVDGWAVDAICQHLQAVVDGQIRKLIINCPPRIGKSNTVSVALPAWIWAQPFVSPTSGPGVPLLYASYADKLSLRDSVKCRRLIESKWYQERWGDRFQLSTDQNTKHRFTNSKGGERLITSIDAGTTGEGGNCFVAGTKVSTPTGEIAIEDILPGTEVWSFDERRGRVIKSRVLAASKRMTSATCTLYEVSGHRFVCTPDHKVFSPGRGFIEAGEMGSGDPLLIAEDAPERPSADVHSFDLRQLRKETKEAALSAAQGAETGESGLLLRERMQTRASFLQKFSTLREVRGRLCWSKTLKMVRSLQASARELGRKTGNCMQELWDTISQKRLRRSEAVLLEGLRELSPFSTDERIWQFEIQERRSRQIWKPVSCDETADSGARRSLLPELWRGRTRSEFKKPKVNVTGSSHRRKQTKRSPSESNHSLRQLPPNAPSCRHTHIKNVVANGDSEVCVYDIQVEGTSCFFAEGILVHNCIIIDDPNSAGDVSSEAAIQNAIEWWTTTMPTRANDLSTCAWVIIQQRLAENDLTGHILEHEADGWTHLCLPGRYEPERSFHTSIGWKDPRTEPGQLLWPERFSEEALNDLERRMGPFIFAGQIQQRPEPKGGGIIRSEWWLKWEAEKFPPMDFVLGVVDTAFTEDELNDPSGMMIWGIFSGDVKAHTTNVVGSQDQKNRMMVRASTTSEFAPHVMLIYAWDKHLQLHELVKEVADTCIRFKVDQLVIENKASGISVAQEIRRLYARETFGVELFDPKSQDKMARLYSVQHIFAEGIVYAPDMKWVDRVIKQVGQFPKGAHDEYVDLTSMGLRKLRDMGLLVRQPEREAEAEEAKVYRGRTEPLYAV